MAGPIMESMAQPLAVEMETVDRQWICQQCEHDLVVTEKRMSEDHETETVMLLRCSDCGREVPIPSERYCSSRCVERRP
jgi:RNase P subunit RPR2